MPSSAKLTHALFGAATGGIPADLVIRNGQWVSVQSEEIIPNTDIAVRDGQLVTVDERKLIERHNKAAKRLLENS